MIKNLDPPIPLGELLNDFVLINFVTKAAILSYAASLTPRPCHYTQSAADVLMAKAASATAPASSGVNFSSNVGKSKTCRLPVVYENVPEGDDEVRTRR